MCPFCDCHGCHTNELAGLHRFANENRRQGMDVAAKTKLSQVSLLRNTIWIEYLKNLVRPEVDNQQGEKAAQYSSQTCTRSIKRIKTSKWGNDMAEWHGRFQERKNRRIASKNWALTGSQS